MDPNGYLFKGSCPECGGAGFICYDPLPITLREAAEFYLEWMSPGLFGDKRIEEIAIAITNVPKARRPCERCRGSGRVIIPDPALSVGWRDKLMNRFRGGPSVR